MLLGRVAGTLVASNKEPSMEGMKFLVLRELTPDNEDGAGYVVADPEGYVIKDVNRAFCELTDRNDQEHDTRVEGNAQRRPQRWSSL